MDLIPTQPDNDQRQKSNMLPQKSCNTRKPDGNNIGIDQGIFDTPTAMNVFSGAPKPKTEI